MADYLNIAGRVRTTASDGVAMEAQEVKDLNLNKSQQEVNADVQTELGDRYTKEETYNKEQLNNLITTPDASYVNVVATSDTTAVTDVLPAEGAADTIYRVGNWDGTQYDPTMYALYAWNGSAYVCVAVRSFVGEVYDVSVNHPDGQGNPTAYADLTAALGVDGANIPADIRRGGMSIKFIHTSDNKYVQYRLMADEWSTDTDDWAIADEGVYVENPEFIEVVTANDGSIIYAVKPDGDIVFGVGIPKVIRNYITSLLNEKVDKTTGKSLINEIYASCIGSIKSPEFLDVITDNKGNIVWSIKKDGSIDWSIGVPTPVKHYINEVVNNILGTSYLDNGIVSLNSVYRYLKNLPNLIFQDKKVSIIGDSISTYDQEGYKIDGYSMYYPNGDVQNVNDTWWKQVLNTTNSVIEINASSGGSTASSRTIGFSPRVSLLGSPDVIFVALGTNDCLDGVEIGVVDYDAHSYDLTKFAPAYIKGMQEIQIQYPNAEVFCMSFDMDDIYANTIKEIAEHYNANYIDLRYKGLLLHPDKKQMYNAYQDVAFCDLSEELYNIKREINKIKNQI